MDGRMVAGCIGQSRDCSHSTHCDCNFFYLNKWILLDINVSVHVVLLATTTLNRHSQLPSWLASTAGMEQKKKPLQMGSQKSETHFSPQATW